MSRFQHFIFFFFRKSESEIFKNGQKYLNIKIGQISLYYCNKIIKGPETSFQFLALSQKHVCHTPH